MFDDFDLMDHRRKVLGAVSEPKLRSMMNRNRITLDTVRAIRNLKSWLDEAEKALKPFAEEYAMWADFPDNFHPRINDYDESEPVDAEFTVGNLRVAAENLGLTCVDEGCLHWGTPHGHGNSDDVSI